MSPIIGKKSSTSWSTFLSTLISATVENAAPTNVILTFPVARTSLGASDFTIVGFTVTSASWTGSVLTLVLSYGVTAYRGNFLITFVRTGQTATVTNNVLIANSVGWYASGDGSSTYVTKDGSDFVSVLKDLSGANHPLNQAVGTNQPLWQSDGILFDGVDNYMRTGAFAYNQPNFIYAVMKHVTFTGGDEFYDGITGRMFCQQNGVSPTIVIYSTIAACTNTGMTLNVFKIMRFVHNGASSFIQVNNTLATTGNIGVTNPGGITLGSYDATFSHSNIKVKELIFRNSADDASTQQSIYNYLANKYGFVII